jgi:hypothetical protein
MRRADPRMTQSAHDGVPAIRDVAELDRVVIATASRGIGMRSATPAVRSGAGSWSPPWLVTTSNRPANPAGRGRVSSAPR